MRLLLATGNPHKAQELAPMLSGLNVELLTLRDFPSLAEVAEDGETLEANASKKALEYAHAAKLWALADDTGLEVDALGGAPGVRSARYAGPGATYADNNAKLLGALRGVPDAKRGAAFRCVLALAAPTGELILEEGRVVGRILEGSRGSKGFGYDPVFYIGTLGKTLAELSAEEKRRIAHRGAALDKMLPHLSRLAGPAPIPSAVERAKGCPRCGLGLDPWHCRLLCPGCGYQEDCSDVALP